MTICARLKSDLEVALERFCRANNVTKTQALEQGIRLLLEREAACQHPAFLAYRQMKLVPESKRTAVKRSSDCMRAAIDAKYPG